MRKNVKKTLHLAKTSILIAIVMMLACVPTAANAKSTGQWVTGDFHSHTYLSDGSKTAAQVAEKAIEYGLDWYSAADHGGGTVGTRDQNGVAWASTTPGLIGTTIPRWLSIFGVGESEINKNRSSILQFSGFEWNVPGHEHASVGMLGDSASVKAALARFDYAFDATKETEATDTLIIDLNPRSADGKNPPSKTTNGDHNGALLGAKFLEDNYPTSSYYLPNHPSRKLAFTIADFREFNDVAPSVCFGAELVPGHQKSSFRGGLGYFTYYDTVLKKNVNLSTGSATTIEGMVDAYIASKTAGTISDKDTIMASLTKNIPMQRTYGGADYMLAKIGGLWDSLLSEGRSFWIFGNSDFHSNDSEEPDFWPGEYSKNHTFVMEKSYQGILDGMRSGNNYVVLGDLISELDYTISNNGVSSVMGSSLNPIQGKTNTVTIKFKSPTKNNANTDGRTGLNETPEVDHVDLIAGEVKGKILNKYVPGTTDFTNNKVYLTAEYQNSDTSATTSVIKTFTEDDWTVDSQGYYVIIYNLPDTDKNMFYRLRGTNVAPGTPGQTDAKGNPLIDTNASSLQGTNTAGEAFNDLWFYTNPIFVNAKFDGVTLEASLLKDDKSAVAGVTVEIGEVSATTDVEGKFTLNNIPIGINTMIVKDTEGNELYQLTFNIKRGDKNLSDFYDLTVKTALTKTNAIFILENNELYINPKYESSVSATLTPISNTEENPQTGDTPGIVLISLVLVLATLLISAIKARVRV